jgi:hypothetical protein
MVKDEYMGENAPLTYRLATFDKKGNLIDKRVVAGYEILSDPMRVATIDAKLNISIELFELKYEKDPDEHGYYDNKIIGKEKVGAETFKLSGNGQILNAGKSKELASN